MKQYQNTVAKVNNVCMCILLFVDIMRYAVVQDDESMQIVENLLPTDEFYRHLLIVNNAVCISQNGKLLIINDYDQTCQALSKVLIKLITLADRVIITEHTKSCDTLILVQC